MCTAHAADDGKESLSLAACPNDLAIPDFDAMSLRGLRFITLERWLTTRDQMCDSATYPLARHRRVKGVTSTCLPDSPLQRLRFHGIYTDAGALAPPSFAHCASAA